MSRLLHNPKSHAPAVYIPCWLIQVPLKLLSHAAKITYGRLSQWANESGRVFRSVPQLSEELGSSVGSVEKYLKELKDVGLIGTFHPQAGGVNHFEFYDHPWMHSSINEHLSYKQDKPTPPPDLTVPPVRSYGTPPPDLTDINTKEIKENKKTLTNCESSSSFIFSETLDKSILEQKLERDPRTNQQFLDEAKEHVDHHSDKKFAHMQRAQAALRLLTKLKNQNVIFYVAGKLPKEEFTNTQKQETIEERNIRWEKERKQNSSLS